VRLEHRPVPQWQAGPPHHAESQVESVRSVPSASSFTVACSICTPREPMADCHHGEYSILMEWLCDCPVVEPRKS